MEQGSSQPRDDSELLAPREQVSKLTTEKASLQEKNKKISKAKRGQSLIFIMQWTSLIRLLFIRVFLLIEYTALTKSLKFEESLVLDLKILMY